MIEGFDNIGLAVTDYRAAVDFYEKLGLKLEFEEGEGGSLKGGNAVIFVFKTSSTTTPQGRDLSLTGNPPGIDHISFRVSDVDAEYTRLRNAGVSVETEPADHHLGSHDHHPGPRRQPHLVPRPVEGKADNGRLA